MIYVQKTEMCGQERYVYGIYTKPSTTNEEWTAKSCDVYNCIADKMTIEFVYDGSDYKETREFIINDIVRIYIGDEWSN